MLKFKFAHLKDIFCKNNYNNNRDPCANKLLVDYISMYFHSTVTNIYTRCYCHDGMLKQSKKTTPIFFYTFVCSSQSFIVLHLSLCIYCGHKDHSSHCQQQKVISNKSCSLTNFQIQWAETITEAHTAMLEVSHGATCKVSTLKERQDLVNAALTYYLEGRIEMPLKQ